MSGTGRYGGMNVWTLARSVRTEDAVCPSCGRPCGLSAEVVRREDGEEDLSVHAVCPDCGETPVAVTVLQDGDVSMVLGDGKAYEPSAAAADARRRAGSSEGEERLRALSDLADALAHTMRESESLSVGKKAIAEARAIGTPSSTEFCLRQASATGSVWMDRGNPDAALEVYDSVKDLAGGNDSAAAFGLVLNRCFAQYSSGEAKEPLAAVRGVIDRLGRLKAANALPEGDPFLMARAYEALGVLLSSKRDRAGAMKALRKASDLAGAVADADPSDESLRWFNRCSREYAFACSEAGMGKRSPGVLKRAIKKCQEHRDLYPGAYAEALLERAMYISDSNSPVPPYLKDDMDEAIAILSKADPSGRYDPLLPVAYFYRSITGKDRENLDGEDLGKAYSILRGGALSGSVPDSVFSAVSTSYLVYLEAHDPERADAVRGELRDMGLFVPAGKSTKRPE